MTIVAGSGGGEFVNILGSCTSSGCPNARLDNMTFNGWAGHTSKAFGINVWTNVFGVLDHNILNGTYEDPTIGANYLELVEVSNSAYLGVGSYGDNSWHVGATYGGTNAIFIENNTFNTAGAIEDEISAGAQSDEGGGNVVVRFNQFLHMDLNYAVTWHGTETDDRSRSIAIVEVYGNSYTCENTVTTACDEFVKPRGGNSKVWGNTINVSGSATLNRVYGPALIRAFASTSPWQQCDGSQPWDTNDGVVYYTGKIVSGAGPTNPMTTPNPVVATIQNLDGSTPSWTVGQWDPSGTNYALPFSLHDVTNNQYGTEILDNDGTIGTLDLGYFGHAGGIPPTNGDTIQILRATVCVDMSGRGASILFKNDPAVDNGTGLPAAAAQPLVPAYVWMNTFTSSQTVHYYAASIDTNRIVIGRDILMEAPGQAAQTSNSSPFDGSFPFPIDVITRGYVGHGTFATGGMNYRPTTCATQAGGFGVGYWATDEGSWNSSGNGFGNGDLYICTATNTWTLSYTPANYPSALINNSLSITTQPQSQNITSGSMATMTVAATGGTPSYSYQWYQGAGCTGSTVGTNSTSYTTAALTMTTTYSVKVTDSVSATVCSNNAVITVGTAPTISVQPQSQTIMSGGTASLSVTASGTATLAYQWYQGGSCTGTAVGTNSSSFGTPTLTMTTTYSVNVSNAFGNVCSSNAVITVNSTPPPVIVGFGGRLRHVGSPF